MSLSGVISRRLTRLPVALKTTFAIAALFCAGQPEAFPHSIEQRLARIEIAQLGIIRHLSLSAF